MKKILFTILLFLTFIINSKAVDQSSAGNSSSCTYSKFTELCNCNSDKISCYIPTLTGKCSMFCMPDNFDSKTCLTCLVSQCTAIGTYTVPNDESNQNNVGGGIDNGLQNLPYDEQNPVGIPNIPESIPSQEDLCTPDEGLNCAYCKNKHSECVENCSAKAVSSEDGVCYSSCYYEGKGYHLKSGKCLECLANFCDYKPEDKTVDYSDLEGILQQLSGDNTSAGNEWNFCDKHGVLVSMQLLNRAFVIAKIIVPIFLIVFGIIELSKAVTSGDQNTINSATQSLIKKIIIGVIVFFIPTIINALFNLVDDYNDLNNNGCYICLFNREEDNIQDCADLIKNSNDN